MQIERYEWYAAIDCERRPCFVSFTDEELAEHPELATDEDARNEHVRKATALRKLASNKDVKSIDYTVMPDGAVDMTIRLKTKCFED